MDPTDEWTEQIFSAVQTGDLDQLRQQIKSDVDVGRLLRATDAKGNNLCHVAAKYNQVSVFKWLYSLQPTTIVQQQPPQHQHQGGGGGAGISLTRKNYSHTTPVFAALKNESLETLDWLIGNNCSASEATAQLDPRKSPGRGQTALHFAAKLGKSRSLNWLAKQFYLVNGGNINQKDNLGNTGLHLAAQNNHLATIKVLLFNGADIRERNVMGMKAQDVASVNGNCDVRDYLIAFECCLAMATETVSLEEELTFYRNRSSELTKVFKQLLLLTKKMLREKARNSLYGGEAADSDEARFNAICENWKRFSVKKNSGSFRKNPLDIVRSRFSQSEFKFDSHFSSEFTNGTPENSCLYGSTGGGSSSASQLVPHLKSSVSSLSGLSDRNSTHSPINCNSSGLFDEYKFDDLALLAKSVTSANLNGTTTTTLQCQRLMSGSSVRSEDMSLQELFEKYPTNCSKFQAGPPSQRLAATTCKESVESLLPRSSQAVKSRTCARDFENVSSSSTSCRDNEARPSTTSSGESLPGNGVRTLGRRERRGLELGLVASNVDSANKMMTTTTPATMEQNIDKKSLEEVNRADECTVSTMKKKPFSLKISLKKWSSKLVPSTGGPQNSSNCNSSSSISGHATNSSVGTTSEQQHLNFNAPNTAATCKVDEMTPAEVHEIYIQGSLHKSNQTPKSSQPSESQLTRTTGVGSSSSSSQVVPEFLPSALAQPTSSVGCEQNITSDAGCGSSSLESIELPEHVEGSPAEPEHLHLLEVETTASTACTAASDQETKSDSLSEDSVGETVTGALVVTASLLEQSKHASSLSKVSSASKEALSSTSPEPTGSQRRRRRGCLGHHSPAPSEVSKTESALMSPHSRSSDSVSKAESPNHSKKPPNTAENKWSAEARERSNASESLAIDRIEPTAIDNGNASAKSGGEEAVLTSSSASSLAVEKKRERKGRSSLVVTRSRDYGEEEEQEEEEEEEEGQEEEDEGNQDQVQDTCSPFRDVKKKQHYRMSGVKSKRTLRKKNKAWWDDLSDEEPDTLMPERYLRSQPPGELGDDGLMLQMPDDAGEMPN